MNSMKHNKTVQPTDSTVTPSGLPDRSNLSELYVRKSENTTHVDPTQENVSTTPEAPLKINQILASTLLTVPLAATYWAADFIYSGADTNIEEADPFFPLLGLFVSAICVLSWIVSLWILKKRFDTYTLGLSIFLIVYLFYLLPALEIVYGGGIHERLGMLLTIALWLIFNYLSVLYMTWSFNRPNHKLVVLSLPVVVLVAGAILI